MNRRILSGSRRSCCRKIILPICFRGHSAPSIRMRPACSCWMWSTSAGRKRCLISAASPRRSCRSSMRAGSRSVRLKPEIAERLGLPADVKVIAGAGDNAAAAVGTATVGDGGCNISLGTSGTLFISSEKFGVDENNALHSFAHADGHYHLMGCMLSAASCNKWWMDEILRTTGLCRRSRAEIDWTTRESGVSACPI